jgi:hypothetical protein
MKEVRPDRRTHRNLNQNRNDSMFCQAIGIASRSNIRLGARNETNL